MSEPIETAANPAEVPVLLRRRDQLLLACLVLLAGLSVVGWWWRGGGPSGRLIEWDRMPRASMRFEVNVNTADWPELTQLPEIGETLARRIVEDRQEAGPFTCPDDLTRVHGIGPKTLDQMRPFLSGASWSHGESIRDASVP